MEIKQVDPNSLKPHPKNPRIHHAIDKIVRSIEEFGFTNPVLVQKGTDLIIAGHGRVEAAKKIGMTTVPVLELDLSSKKAQAYLIADNKLAQESDWENNLLKNVLVDLKAEDYDLTLTGFDTDELLKFFPSTDEEEPVPDPPLNARAKKGAVYTVGKHRLMCGDSTSRDDVAFLMDGAHSNMIHTDPPYNVDYGVSKKPKHKIRMIENDKQSPEEWEKFCKDLYVIFREFNTGDIYMWGASGPEGMRMRLWLVDTGCHWSATIIWKKQQLVLSPAKYQRMYEPCFYGWFDKSSFGDDRKQTEVWEINRPLDSKLHPTMKPIELCERAILNSSEIGDVVLDLFGGSGSTLIACEKINRACRMMEIDPGYCDVIIQRFCNKTGVDLESIYATEEAHA